MEKRAGCEMWKNLDLYSDGPGTKMDDYMYSGEKAEMPGSAISEAKCAFSALCVMGMTALCCLLCHVMGVSD